MRVAAIDCGTNSIRLLIADIEGKGANARMTDVVRRMEIVRLGQGVDTTGRFNPEALARTLAMVDEYAAHCAELGVSKVRFVATSATRDAADRDTFVAGVRGALGIEPEVISGAQEARLSFLGATRGLAGVDSGPVLVVDIGGGSTEAALGVVSTEHGSHAGAEPGGLIASRSVDIGCVRLSERHRGAVAGTTADALAGVDLLAQAVPFNQATALIGLAGSVTTVTAQALGLTEYDSHAIHGANLPIEQLIEACDRLIALSPQELASLAFVHPGRRDVLRAGALIWRSVLQRVQQEAGLGHAISSEHDILDGIAWALSESEPGDDHQSV